MSPKVLYSYTVGVPTADFRTALGKDAEYAFGMTPWLPEKQLEDDWFGNAEAFANEYQQKFGYAPDYHAASAVADVEVFAKAIAAAGSLEPAKVRDAIAKVEFDSIFGHVKFQPNGQISLPQTVIQIQDGKVVPIFAEDFLGKPRYTLPPWERR
jgi:branched-chain amino acid transport system substrate-binding protein